MRKTIRVSEIVRDPYLQGRDQIYETIVVKYADMLKSGTQFDPITVYNLGTEGNPEYYVVDGFHRIAAAVRVHGVGTAIVAEVIPGTYEEAVLFAMLANIKHGYQLTEHERNECIRRIHEKFPKMTQKEIGDMVGLSFQRISEILRENSGEQNLQENKPSVPGEGINVSTDALIKATTMFLDAITKDKPTEIKVYEVGRKVRINKGLAKALGITPVMKHNLMMVTPDHKDTLITKYRELTGEEYLTAFERKKIAALGDKEFQSRQWALDQKMKALEEQRKAFEQQTLEFDQEKAERKKTVVNEVLKMLRGEETGIADIEKNNGNINNVTKETQKPEEKAKILGERIAIADDVLNVIHELIAESKQKLKTFERRDEYLKVVDYVTTWLIECGESPTYIYDIYLESAKNSIKNISAIPEASNPEPTIA